MLVDPIKQSGSRTETEFLAKPHDSSPLHSKADASQATHDRSSISPAPTSKFLLHPPTRSLKHIVNFPHSSPNTTPPPRRWLPPTSPQPSTPPRKTSKCYCRHNATSAARTCRCTWSPTCGRRGRMASTSSTLARLGNVHTSTNH